LVTGRLSSHPSCLIILDSIDPKPEETKQYLQTLSSVIHALVSISPHLRILITTRSSEICQLQPPLPSLAADADAAPLPPSFTTEVIKIGRLYLSFVWLLLFWRLLQLTIRPISLAQIKAGVVQSCCVNHPSSPA
jgi:hypothetical protein